MFFRFEIYFFWAITNTLCSFGQTEFSAFIQYSEPFKIVDKTSGKFFLYDDNNYGVLYKTFNKENLITVILSDLSEHSISVNFEEKNNLFISLNTILNIESHEKLLLSDGYYISEEPIMWKDNIIGKDILTYLIIIIKPDSTWHCLRIDLKEGDDFPPKYSEFDFMTFDSDWSGRIDYDDNLYNIYFYTKNNISTYQVIHIYIKGKIINNKILNVYFSAETDPKSKSEGPYNYNFGYLDYKYVKYSSY